MGFSDLKQRKKRTRWGAELLESESSPANARESANEGGLSADGTAHIPDEAENHSDGSPSTKRKRSRWGNGEQNVADAPSGSLAGANDLATPLEVKDNPNQHQSHGYDLAQASEVPDAANEGTDRGTAIGHSRSLSNGVAEVVKTEVDANLGRDQGPRKKKSRWGGGTSNDQTGVHSAQPLERSAAGDDSHPGGQPSQFKLTFGKPVQQSRNTRQQLLQNVPVQDEPSHPQEEAAALPNATAPLQPGDSSADKQETNEAKQDALAQAADTTSNQGIPTAELEASQSAAKPSRWETPSNTQEAALPEPPAAGQPPSQAPMAAQSAPSRQPSPSLPNLAHQPCSLVVSSIRPTANEDSLKLLFESAGKVLGCRIVRKDGSAQHSGFGFVMMSSHAEAEIAATKLNGFLWGDQRLQVSLKPPAAEPPVANETPEEALPPPPARPSWSAWGSSLGPGPAPPLHAVASQPGMQILEQAGSAPQAPSAAPIAAPPSAPMTDPGSYAGYENQYGYDSHYAYYGEGYDYSTAYSAYPTGMEDPHAHNGANGQVYAAPDQLYASHEAYAAPAAVNEDYAPGMEGAEDDRPPGVEDDALPPGEEPAEEASLAEAEGQQDEDRPPGVSDDERPPGEEKESKPESPAKKEAVVIKVPLKIPEGAKKKQEQRRRAREERRKAEGTQAAPASPQRPRIQPVKAEPVAIVKGTFKEVLARREAELAALKRLKEKPGPPPRPSPPRRFSRSPIGRQNRFPARRVSRSPPIRRVLSRSPVRRASRSPFRRRRGPSRSPSRQDSSPIPARRRFISPSRPSSRSPGRRRTRSRSYSPRFDRRHASPIRSRSRSYSSSPSRYDARSPSVDDDNLDGHKRFSSRRRQADAEPLLQHSHQHLDRKVSGGPEQTGQWTQVSAAQEKRQRAVVLEPLSRPETESRGEAVFRKPERKKRRNRTRWQKDGNAEPPDGSSSDDEPIGRAAENGAVEEAGEVKTAKATAPPQDVEEGEIILEDGEIEGLFDDSPKENKRQQKSRKRTPDEEFPPTLKASYEAFTKHRRR